MFRYELTHAIASDLQRFDQLAGRFDVIATLPRTWSGRVRRDLESEAIGASVALEGVRVTVDEVHRILAGDRPAGVSEETRALVEGYREGMWTVLNRADDPAFEWTTEIFLTIHASVMARSFVMRAGRFREGQVWVTHGSGQPVFTPPAASEVPELMMELVRWLDRGGEGEHPLVSAALLHAWLAAVHPFKDGNGRVARIAASLVMYRRGLKLPQFTSLEEWWGTHAPDYYAAFNCLGSQWNPTVDATPFVAAHVRAQCCQAEAMSLRYATERVLWTVLEDIVVHELGMNPRAAHALWDAFFGREVTNRYYRDLADVPQVTASHDLKQLQTSGMLVPAGAGRSRSFTAGGILHRRVCDLLGLDVPEPAAGPADTGLRSAIVTALAEKVACT